MAYTVVSSDLTVTPHIYKIRSPYIVTGVDANGQPTSTDVGRLEQTTVELLNTQLASSIAQQADIQAKLDAISAAGN